MGIFSRMFGSKEKPEVKEEKKVATKVLKKELKVELPKNIDLGFKSMSSKSEDLEKCIGLDPDVLDLLFFKSPEDRGLFISKYEAIIKKYKLDKAQGVVEFSSSRSKIYDNKEVDPLFFYGLIDVEGQVVNVWTVDGVTEKSPKEIIRKELTEKINGQYDPPRFYKLILLHNIENGKEDIEKELRHVVDLIKLDDERERLNMFSLYQELASVYFSIQKYNECKEYNAKIINDTLLSNDKALAKHYKDLGNQFISVDPEFTLECFKKAISFNSRIGLKGKIEELEKTID